MKNKLITLILVLICFCYYNTEFELSDTEKKANFENDNQICTQQHNNHYFENGITQPLPHIANILSLTSFPPSQFVFFDSISC